MGTEFGQFREWDYEDSLEWFMLDYETHHEFREYVAALNRFYLREEALWSYDFSYLGFEWIIVDEKEKNVIAFKRKGIKDELTVFLNFSGKEQEIKFFTEKNAKLKCVFSSDGFSGEKILISKKCGDSFYIETTLPAFSGRIYSAKKTEIITY